MELGKVRVNGISAETVCRKKIPRGIVGATVGLEFTDPLWDGLTKIAVFWGSCVRTVRDPGSVVQIPWEVVAEAGFQLRMGVYGVDEQNNLVIPTIWAELGMIEYAADPAGDPAMDPQLPIWTELQRQIDGLSNSAMRAEEKSIILLLLKRVAYTSDMSAEIARLESLWSGADIPDVPVEPDIPDIPDEPDEPDIPVADVMQSGSVLSIVSGVAVSQSGSVLAIV